MVDLSIEIAGMELKNPVMVASGTFGYGREYAEFFDLSRLGAVMVKGVSSEPWTGNPVPRIVETPSGMLNAIGLQNPGVDYFLEVDLPWLRGFDTRIIVNIIGRSVEEYADVAARLSAAGGIDALKSISPARTSRKAASSSAATRGRRPEWWRQSKGRRTCPLSRSFRPT